MKRNVAIAFAAGALALIVGWYLLIYSPKNDDLDKAKSEVSAAQTQTASLQARLRQVQSQQKNSVEAQAQLGRLNAAIPEQADLAEFIIQARQIADDAGIEFLSIAPSPPAAAGTLSTIALSISIQGSFFQVKNYLSELEKLERLVMIDTINISAGSGDGSTTEDSTGLSVSLTGRMFTHAQPTAPGTTPAPGTDPSATSSTSSTVPGTGASSSSTPASTVPGGSSTTGGT